MLKGLDTIQPIHFGSCDDVEHDEFSVLHVHSRGRSPSGRRIAQDWERKLVALLEQVTQPLSTVSNWESITFEEITALKDRIRRLEMNHTVNVPITSLAPEPLAIKKPLYATVEMIDGEFVASIVDASVSSSGRTRNEALENLKDVVVATYEILSAHDPDKLGPGPTKQLALLQDHIGEL